MIATILTWAWRGLLMATVMWVAVVGLHILFAACLWR